MGWGHFCSRAAEPAPSDIADIPGLARSDKARAGIIHLGYLDVARRFCAISATSEMLERSRTS